MSTRQRRVLFVAVLFSLVFLQGCWVGYVYPIREEGSKPVFDSALLGRWQQSAGCALNITGSEAGGYYYLEYTVSRTVQNDPCLLSPGGKLELQGGLVRVGKNLFFDVEPNEGEPLYLPLHSIFKVKLDSDTLSLVPVDPEWLGPMLESKKVTLKGRDYAIGKGDGFAVTSEPQEVRAFLAKYGDDPKAFNERDGVWRFTRAADDNTAGQPASPK
jgi:hypothetical protein